MKYTIEKADFDEAVKQPFDWFTCLIAQYSRRTGQLLPSGKPKVFASNVPGEIRAKLMRTFDQHFSNPGDETKPELVALRASLPLEINIP